jgi:hypothetical protein
VTRQESKVGVFVLATITTSLVSSALTRIATLHHTEPGSVVCLIAGAVFLVWTITHVGLED